MLLPTTVEPRHKEVLGTMKIKLLFRGFCYIRPLYNEVPLYYLVGDIMDGKGRGRRGRP